MKIIWMFTIISLTFEGSESIYGGADAEKGDFPYAVSIREYGTDHYCGGAIINEHCIITSAVCLEVFRFEGSDPIMWKPKDLVAYAGMVSLDDQSATVLGIEEITRHAEFNISTLAHDLALARTKDEILWTAFIAPVALPSDDKPPKEGLEVTVAGWGFANENNQTSRILQYLQTTVMRRDLCHRYLKSVDLEGQEIDKYVLCTENIVGGSICQYDQGSPLVDIEGFLIGIASWFVIGRCGEGFPDVYTQYIVYEEWSKSTIEESNVRIAFERERSTEIAIESTEDELYPVNRDKERDVSNEVETVVSAEKPRTDADTDSIRGEEPGIGKGKCCICNCNQNWKVPETWQPSVKTPSPRPFLRRQFLPDTPLNWTVLARAEVFHAGTDTLNESMMAVLLTSQAAIYILKSTYF